MSKKVSIALIGIFAAVIIFKSAIERIWLDKRGVYVIGKLSDVKEGVKGSTNYTFLYWYKGKEYKHSFSGQISHNTFKNSLIFIKVFPLRPYVSRQVEDVDVPLCLKFSDTVLTKLPNDEYCDSINRIGKRK